MKRTIYALIASVMLAGCGGGGGGTSGQSANYTIPATSRLYLSNTPFQRNPFEVSDTHQFLSTNADFCATGTANNALRDKSGFDPHTRADTRLVLSDPATGAVVFDTDTLGASRGGPFGGSRQDNGDLCASWAFGWDQLRSYAVAYPDGLRATVYINGQQIPDPDTGPVIWKIVKAP